MKNTTMPEKGTMERERVLAYLKTLDDKRSIVDVEIDDKTITDGNREYLVLTNDEADQMAFDYIKESLWAFNADFILGECGLDLSGVESLRHMQEKSCESANDFILSLVEKTCGLEEFAESAISADGRGHFLNTYDGEETEIQVGKIMFYVYRIN